MAADDMPISMSWAQWKVIDATMDNTRSIAAVDLDTQVVDRTSAIRATGWVATGHIDGPYMDRGEWPPPAEVHSTTVTISLSTTDWDFVLDELGRWSEVGEEEAEEERAIARLISAALHPN